MALKKKSLRQLIREKEVPGKPTRVMKGGKLFIMAPKKPKRK